MPTFQLFSFPPSYRVHLNKKCQPGLLNASFAHFKSQTKEGEGLEPNNFIQSESNKFTASCEALTWKNSIISSFFLIEGTIPTGKIDYSASNYLWPNPFPFHFPPFPFISLPKMAAIPSFNKRRRFSHHSNLSSFLSKISLKSAPSALVEWLHQLLCRKKKFPSVAHFPVSHSPGLAVNQQAVAVGKSQIQCQWQCRMNRPSIKSHKK